MSFNSDQRPARPARMLWAVLAVALGALAISYHVRGHAIFWDVTGRNPTLTACDAQSRWREIHYVLRGENPYDVLFAHTAGWPPMPPNGRDASVDPALGTPINVGYPPWAYVSGMAFFATPAVWLRPVLSVWLIGATGVLGKWAWDAGRGMGPAVAAAMAAAVLAIGGWAAAIYTGNYPLPVVAMLVGVLIFATRQQDLAAGLLLGVALLKPTLAGPFVLPLLVLGRWRAVAVAAAFVAAESGVCWALTHTSPWEMLHQMGIASAAFSVFGYSALGYLARWGVDPQRATLLTAGGGMAVGAVAVWLGRRAGMLPLFAIAAVVARVSTYHYFYDDGVLAFLVLAFGLWAARRNTATAWAAFLLVGLSLWSPPRLLNLEPMEVGRQVVWVAAAALIAWRPADFADGSLPATASGDFRELA